MMAKASDHTTYKIDERYYYPYYKEGYVTKVNHTDEEIHHAVVSMIAGDSNLHHDTIHVTVQNGQVILDGTVDTFFEKRIVGDHAADIKGVKNVINNLNLSSV